MCWIVFTWISLHPLVSRCAFGEAPSHPDRQQTEVLFLSLADPDLPDIASLVDEAETKILEGRSAPVHFSLEYLDSSLLNTGPRRRDQTLSFLRAKHETQTFDLVIAIGEETSGFGEQSLASLFPNVPFIFCVDSPTDNTKWLPPKQGSTGVIRKLNYLPTLQLALTENPGTHEVVVIAGSSEFEKLELQVAHDEFHSYEPSIEFQYWTDLRLADLQSRIATAQNDTVIIFLDFLSDVAGEKFIPSRILPSIMRDASRPVYGTVASFVGKGIVGGSVVDLHEVGGLLGREAARVLNGEKPDAIPVQTGEFQHDIFDWRELNRWGINADQLPPDSSVLYWENSPWEVYRWRIVALSAAVLVETLLIFLLLRNRSKRRRAEEALQRREAELSEAQRLAQLGSWQWNPTTDIIHWSDALYHLTGFDPGEPMPPFQLLAPFVAPDSWKQLNNLMEAALRTGEAYELEMKFIRPDGKPMWFFIHGEAVRDAKGYVVLLRGTMQDITDRRRAEEARLRHAAILESSDDAIISQSLTGIITSWNPGARRIFGYSEPEAVGQPISIVIPPELEEEENLILRRALGGERIEHYETSRINREKSRVVVSLTMSPIRDLTGRIVGLSSIARDITESKRAAEQLKNSEEMFAKAFRQGPMAVTLTDAKTYRYIDVNDTFERFTGFSREELIGRNALDSDIWAEPTDLVKLANKLMADEKVRGLELKFRTKNGLTRIAETSAELIEIENQQCVLGVIIDITDRKQAEQRLQESEKRFRLMADSAPVLMWISGPDKLCTDFNQEWLSFTGRMMQQELGDGWMASIYPDDLQSCRFAYIRAFDSRQAFSTEFRLRRHDAQYRWMLNRGVPRFLGNGEFSGYIGCCIDITEQKEAKAAQAELGGRLIQAQEAERARIARDLHDDINQRLALLANGLQELWQIAPERDAIEQKQIGDLWHLTGEIAADVQHISHQLHPSKLHYLGLAAAVRDLCQEFSKLHKIDVECVTRDLSRDLDENTSLTLFRIVQESLRNIAKHSRARHVKVDLCGRPTGILLRVSDDGVGFDARHRRNGEGLGLVSMQERLKVSGGVLTIWSRPSLGTQVEAIVPLSNRQVRSA